MPSLLRSSVAGAAALVFVGCSLLVDTSGLAGGADSASPNDGGADAIPDAPSSGDDGGTLPDGAPLPKMLVSAGGNTTCAAIGSSLWCWGDDSRGQIGDGTTGAAHNAPATPVIGLPAGDVTSVGVGENHVCAIVAGDIYCWGDDGEGALGDGKKTDSSVAVKVTGLPAGKATVVSGGSSFTCAVVDGTAWCWGTNGSGQCGSPAGAVVATPVTVLDGTTSMALTSVDQVWSGQDHACARKTNGDVWCWGHNDSGTLGTSAVNVGAVAPKAVQVQGLPGPAQLISIAGWHACALVSGGVWCWGTGMGGELGNGSSSDTSTPTAATGLGSGVSTLAVGGGAADYDATCAIQNGQVLCWGNDQSGRLGDGQSAARAAAYPVQGLPPNATATAVVSAYDHACALLGDRDLRCWGRGTSGQLGDGAGVDRPAPVAVKLPP